MRAQLPSREVFLLWDWPSGDWHVGAKRAFELFPGGLEKRIKGERKKRFAEEQRAALTAATAAAAAAPKVSSSPHGSPAAPRTYLPPPWHSYRHAMLRAAPTLQARLLNLSCL